MGWTMVPFVIVRSSASEFFLQSITKSCKIDMTCRKMTDQEWLTNTSTRKLMTKLLTWMTYRLLTKNDWVRILSGCIINKCAYCISSIVQYCDTAIHCNKLPICNTLQHKYVQPVPWKMRLEMVSRNGERNANRNSEWWGHFSQLVIIEKIKFLGISWYQVELRFWLQLNSKVSCGKNPNWDFCLTWIYRWLKYPHHSGFWSAFPSPFRVSSSRERAVSSSWFFFVKYTSSFIVKIE